MEGVIEHRTVNAEGGVKIHVAIKGPEDGPVVLLLHGFPDLWYSWRHQISALADYGYRALAPDLRGYGDSESPPEISSYTCLDVTGDIVAVINAVAGDQKKVFVVGHDWGAVVAWCLSLFRPDIIKAMVILSVAFGMVSAPRMAVEYLKPTDAMRYFYSDDYFICRFQEEPGEVESEIEEMGIERVMKMFLTYQMPKPLMLPKYMKYAAAYYPLPAWLSDDDVRYYVSKFRATGFSGPLNYFRNIDRNDELLRAWEGAKVQVPVKFIIGDQDSVYHLMGVTEYIHGGWFKKDVPLLEPPVVMEGAAHFINQEKPQEITNYIYDFINKF